MHAAIHLYVACNLMKPRYEDAIKSEVSTYSVYMTEPSRMCSSTKRNAIMFTPNNKKNSQTELHKLAPRPIMSFK
jgi:hypothetical protein